MAPECYKEGTSYEDYDTIHGSRKEYRIEDLLKKIDDINAEIERLYSLIEVDKKILQSKLSEIDIEEHLKEIDLQIGDKSKKNKDKVKFLRSCGYTQEKAARKIGITKTQVYRIERSLRNEERLKIK